MKDDKMATTTPRPTGLSRLIESDIEKAEIVIAAKAIPDKLQSMAEDLAKIEADEIMPMMDTLRTALGPQAAERFSQVTTDKVRELLDAVKASKTAIDGEIDNLESAADGQPVSDASLDADAMAPAAPESADAAAPDATAAQPAPGADDAASGAAPADPSAPEGAAPAGDAFDMPSENDPQMGAAGRAKKESAAPRGNRLAEMHRMARKALRESKNPDKVVTDLFRSMISEGRAVPDAVRLTAGVFQIDESDVASVVRSRRDASRRKLSEKTVPTRFYAKYDDRNMWYDIVDEKGKLAYKDASPNKERAVKIASTFKPGQIVEGARRRTAPAPR